MHRVVEKDGIYPIRLGPDKLGVGGNQPLGETMSSLVTVLAAKSQEVLHTKGAEVEEKHYMVDDAKRRARYLLTEDYRITSESSEKLGYSEVWLCGNCVVCYFGRG
jgi:hypothetical protein